MPAAPNALGLTTGISRNVSLGFFGDTNICEIQGFLHSRWSVEMTSFGGRFVSTTAALVRFFLMQRPADAAYYLRHADHPRQCGACGKLAHQAMPQLRPLLPGPGVVSWIHDRHDAVADQNHRRKVFCPFWIV